MDLGKVDLQEEVERRAEELYTPNWFSVELKTGGWGGRGGERRAEKLCTLNWFSVELKTGVGGEGEGEEGRGVAGETCA